MRAHPSLVFIFWSIFLPAAVFATTSTPTDVLVGLEKTGSAPCVMANVPLEPLPLPVLEPASSTTSTALAADPIIQVETATSTPEEAPSPPPEIVAAPQAPLAVPLPYLSEFAPTPLSGEKEWIEVWNHGEGELPANTCVFHDAKGLVASIETAVPPKSFLVVQLKTAKLNNDGDTVALVCGGSIRDAVSYEAAPPAGGSIARVSLPEGTWMETDTPTPGKENIVPRPEPSKPPASSSSEEENEDTNAAEETLSLEEVTETVLEEAKDVTTVAPPVIEQKPAPEEVSVASVVPRPKKVAVKKKPVKKAATTKKKATKMEELRAVSGTALAESNVFSKAIIPIETADGVLLLELPKNTGSIQRGDAVAATGTPRTLQGRPLLRVKEIGTTPGDPPTPTMLSAIDEVDEVEEGALVTIEGTSIGGKGQQITLSNNGEIAVRLPTGLEARAAWKEGAEVRATGIVKVGKTGERQILPRDTDDLVLLAPAPLPAPPEPEKKPTAPAAAGATGAAGATLALSLWNTRGLWKERLFGIFKAPDVTA